MSSSPRKGVGAQIITQAGRLVRSFPDVDGFGAQSHELAIKHTDRSGGGACQGWGYFGLGLGLGSGLGLELENLGSGFGLGFELSLGLG